MLRWNLVERMVRKAFLFWLFITWFRVDAQQIRINEIALTTKLPVALQHVEVELYNAGSEAVNLRNFRFFVEDKIQVIQSDEKIAAKGFVVFSFGKKGGDSPKDLSMKLPWSGATLMLLNATGERLVDMVIYPELLRQGSFGRCPDGAVKPAYATKNTIGFACSKGNVQERRSGEVSMTYQRVGKGFEIELNSTGEEIRYTLDGTAPTKESLLYKRPVQYTQSAGVIRARSFTKHMHPSALFVESLLPIAEDLGVVSLTLKDADLWNDSLGIYTEGNRANFARKGKRWERSGSIQTQASGAAMWNKQSCGIRISGSGTRSLEKRSFKLFRRPRYGDEDFGFFTSLKVDEVVLRADATANSFLQNKFIEELAGRYARHCDVQTSTPLELYLNGTYWGLYRAMPAKDPLWIEEKNDVAGVDMLAGGGYRVVQGSDDGLDAFLALAAKGGLNSEELDQLEGLVNVPSMIEMAAIDIYTGRADHELNTRMWRERNGKWQWVVYDFDLWMLANDRSLERMLSEPLPVAPYLKMIWHTPQLRNKLLAYFTAVLNGPLSSADAVESVTEIHNKYVNAMQRDYELWQDSLGVLKPNEALNALKSKVASRPQQLHAQLSEFGTNEMVRIPVEQPSGGELLLDGIPISTRLNELTGFSSVMVLVEARAHKGMDFLGWKGIDHASPLLLVEFDKVQRLAPKYGKKRLAGN